MNHIENHLARQLALLAMIGVLHLLIQVLEQLVLDLSGENVGLGRGAWPCTNAEVWRIVQAFKCDVVEFILNMLQSSREDNRAGGTAMVVALLYPKQRATKVLTAVQADLHRPIPEENVACFIT